MGTAATITLTTAKLVSAGVCLGVGFWISKKLTGRLDYYLVLYDKKFHKELEEMAAPALVQ